MMEIKVNQPVSSASAFRNLEQIRAKNAYSWRDKIGTGNEGGRAVAKKVPAQIIQNGFLGALAFAIENKGSGYENVFFAIMDHLKNAELNQGVSCESPQQFLDELCVKDADVLRAITAESLAYLNYLRRFAKPDKNEQGE
jgi:CRISPR type III-B/RAMP module-associated protein Cmr5